MKSNTSVTKNQITSLSNSSTLTEIKNLHSEILEAARTSLEKAIRVGELLTSAKAELKHGQWMPWLKENIPFSQQTANNYMRVFAERDRLKLTNIGNLSEAYALLEERTPTVPPQLTKAKRSQEDIDEIVNFTAQIFISQRRPFTIEDVLALRKSLAA